MLFKLQREASVVVVEDGDVAGFRAAVFVAAVGQGLGLLHMLYRQVTYDIFFMDWEKPRRVLTRGGGREESAPVSCWRMLFVANEWNELQAVRKTSPAFTMLCMVLFLEGLHLSWAARMDPNEHNLDWNPYSQDSSLLRVGTDAGLFIFIAAVQLLYVGAFAQRFLLHPLAQFVDLLFLANISCIILDDKLAGYYLHGRNQSQFSDTSIVELNNALLQEEEGLVANRGLAAGNSTLGDPEVKENQTFQVYLTRAQRERYEGIMLEHMHSAARHQGSAQGLLRNGRKPSHRPKESALEARARILDDFKSLVVQIENNHAEQVLPSSFLGRILRLPPELSAQKAVLVHDFHSSFGNVLLYGNEVRLIMFELVMFCALDVSLKSPGIVAFLVYLISRLITWVRKSCGERNISRKTMVGRHFLM
ncbi:unnamed protein product [Ostreobium quekettii]|uniref:Uncharacterized protein n=1 Tax=Ostreobium quekettii TaxID=121088 RepID=A0A8S1J8X6_9CHLO|nr:unnamed protein product [Ostreobium quekettii]